MSPLEAGSSDSTSNSPFGDTVDSDLQTNAVPFDTDVYGSETNASDADTTTGYISPDSTTHSAVSNTGSNDADTLFTNREPHFCDDLGWDACIDAEDECGRMYLESVHFLDSVGVSSSCETESLFYGCTPWKYCYKDIFLAFDPDGRCWLMPTGCLPNSPGWMPAVDDEKCREPILVHSCIE